MIEIYTGQFAGVEALHAVPAGQKAAALPTVVFYHGFSSSKTVYSYFAVALAQAGFRAILPDAPRHGARFDGDATARAGQFWQILAQNIAEFAPFSAALHDAGLVTPGQLYVAGASLGGMTALGLMSAHPEINAVASLMGSGYYTTLARALYPPNRLLTPDDRAAFDAVLAPLARLEAPRNLARLGNRPLFLWHGEEDDVVPATESVSLQQALHTAGLAKNLTCQWEAGVKHRITPVALEGCVAFFRRVAAIN
ncbi:esterase [Siccibacter turicensis]|uniref:esterase n=1 Tax=Siccibacter turicensis TaxID=357233 RepID=UPI0023F3CC7D|nr:esterase [Siccibacter turicensis]